MADKLSKNAPIAPAATTAA
jgi:sodium/hydrogen exchanger 8